jgi:hypothetical protein
MPDPFRACRHVSGIDHPIDLGLALELQHASVPEVDEQQPDARFSKDVA